MNIILSAAILLVPLSSLGASTYDEAQVLSAEPVYETVRREFPVQACREEQVAYRTGRHGFTTGPILGAIIGGALGNLFDRIYYYAVPDFIDFHIGNFHWFIFNVADIFITIGIIALIVIEVARNKKKVENA